MRWNRAWNANEYWYAIDDVVIQYMRVIEIFEVHVYANSTRAHSKKRRVKQFVDPFGMDVIAIDKETYPVQV